MVRTDPETMKFRCIVFDFDGTLADTLEATMLVLNELALEYGFRQMERHEVHGVKHMTVAQFVRFLGIPAWRLPRLLTKGKRRLTQRLPGIRPFPGIPETIRTLRQRTEVLGILTSNSVANVESFLGAQGIGPFDFISSAPKLMGKARYLRAIVRQHGLSPEEILYVGDEIRDIEAAHEAEIPVAAATWGFNSEEALLEGVPDYVLRDPRDLIGICAPEA
jgi:phosphoglycolate phosphatase